MKTLKITVNLEIPYHEYKTQLLNKRAESAIKKWVKSFLNLELAYIPIYVEYDSTGAAIEDVTGKIKNQITICTTKMD